MIYLKYLCASVFALSMEKREQKRFSIFTVRFFLTKARVTERLLPMYSFFVKLCFSCLCLALLVSCKPADEILTSRPKPVTFSEDAIVFDTVFTALPTVTQYFNVRNPNKNAVLIKSIRLGDAASPYVVTVSGRPLAAAQNIQLRGGDSLLVLVKINIPARDSAQPFVLYDSLLFDMQTTTPNIKLLAWGQDAVFVKQKTLSCDQTWKAGKPYILYDSVTVAAGCRLTIEPGTRVYAFTNAALIVDGSLRANGTAESPISFSGFRQDGPYREASGLWRGLVFRKSNENTLLNFVQIRNATNALLVDTPDNDNQPDVVVQNTSIQYARQAGILAIDSDVQATNTRITQCGEFHFAGLGGGNYRLWHCTLVGEPYLLQRENPTLLFSDYVNVNGVDRKNSIFCEVKNSVVWGVLPEEVGFVQQTQAPFVQDFSNNLLKSVPNALLYNTSNLLETDPSFADIRRLNFSPNEKSPLIDAGLKLGVPYDLTGKPRDAKPDIGAYEK